MSQEQRDRVMSRLRSGTAELLVATDVAARGLDVDHLTHVFNYDVPADPQIYVHRIGRVGRAGRIGTALTLTEPRERRQLRNIESQTGVVIDQQPVPSVSDLRNQRLRLLIDEFEAALASADLSEYEPVLDALAERADARQIALAAIQIARDAGARSFDEEEIPAVAKRPDRQRPDRQRAGAQGSDVRRDDRQWSRERSTSHRADGPGQGRPQRSGDGRRRDDVRGGRQAGGRGQRGPAMARIFVAAGNEARIRPGDLVGAIANETSLNGRDIGSIEIRDRFSLVEVPDSAASEVITALNRTTLKGRKVKVRRDRF